MVNGWMHHLTFAVVLQSQIDYFDIIPDVEKQTRCRVRLNTHEHVLDKPVLCIKEISTLYEDHIAFKQWFKVTGQFGQEYDTRAQELANKYKTQKMHCIEIVLIREHEDRLTHSSFYQQLEMTWPDAPYAYAPDVCIKEELVDIKLSATERGVLDAVLNHPCIQGQTVPFIGWVTSKKYM